MPCLGVGGILTRTERGVLILFWDVFLGLRLQWVGLIGPLSACCITRALIGGVLRWLRRQTDVEGRHRGADD